jgi:hypothetical protein
MLKSAFALSRKRQSKSGADEDVIRFPPGNWIADIPVTHGQLPRRPRALSRRDNKAASPSPEGSAAVPVSTSFAAGFEVSIIGRFSDVHRGIARSCLLAADHANTWFTTKLLSIRFYRSAAVSCQSAGDYNHSRRNYDPGGDFLRLSRYENDERSANGKSTGLGSLP